MADNGSQCVYCQPLYVFLAGDLDKTDMSDWQIPCCCIWHLVSMFYLVVAVCCVILYVARAIEARVIYLFVRMCRVV